MDHEHEANREEQVEYAAPAITDYGDIQAITATNQTNNLSDVPIGTQVNNGFSR